MNKQKINEQYTLAIIKEQANKVNVSIFIYLESVVPGSIDFLLHFCLLLFYTHRKRILQQKKYLFFQKAFFIINGRVKC